MSHEPKSPSLGMISTATRTTATVSPLTPSPLNGSIVANGSPATQSTHSGFAAALRKLAKQAEEPRGKNPTTESPFSLRCLFGPEHICSAHGRLNCGLKWPHGCRCLCRDEELTQFSVLVHVLLADFLPSHGCPHVTGVHVTTLRSELISSWAGWCTRQSGNDQWISVPADDQRCISSAHTCCMCLVFRPRIGF